jgi:glycosyltransferase involved in cell wall biosynthesis
MNVYGRFTLNYFARNTDNLLVGWRFGSNALGFYKKAYDLFVLSAGQLTAPITNVAVAALSRYNSRSEEYRQNLLNAISVTSFIGMGLSGVFVLIGKDLIRVLLGAKWDPAGQIFTFFAPGIGAMLLYFVHGWIHLSIGRADRWFRWGILEIVVTFLFFLIGLPWGPDGIAVAWSASFWVLTLPSLWYAGKPIGFGVGPVVSVLWRYIAAAILAGSIVFLAIPPLSHFLPPLGTFDIAALRSLSVSLLFCLAYLLAVVVFHGGTKPLVQFARIFADMTSRRTQGKAIPSDSLSQKNVPQQASSNGDEHRPLVSILIPAFNSEEWIADTLKSALAQTWEPKEIIVVDDGSTDRTLSVVRNFVSAGVRIVTQTNQGAAAARNHALRLSRGDYVQWLDADDLLAPDKIALQMEEASKSVNKRILLSSAFGKFKYRYYRTKFLPTPLWRDQKAADWLVSKLSQNVYMQTATWLVSRELTEVSGPWDIRLLGDDDGEYFCRVLLACDRVKFVPEAKVYYRAPWFGTLSHVGSSKRKIEAHWLSMQLHIGYLRSIEDSDRVRRACLRYLQTCFIYFYPERPEIIQSAQSLAKELGGQLSPPQLNWK